MHQPTFLTESVDLPKPAHPERAELRLERLVKAARQQNSGNGNNLVPALESMSENTLLLEYFAAIMGNSSFLSQCAIRDPEFCHSLIMTGPDQSFVNILKKIDTYEISDTDDGRLMKTLRQCRQQAALTIASADIASLWTGVQVTDALSRFAEAALQTTIRFLLSKSAANGLIILKEPENPEMDSGLIVFGMGKLGAGELNYSSDIDLIVFYDPELVQTDQPDRLQKSFVRLTRDMVKILSERTEDGYVFRTDLRLRPDPGSTPPAVSVMAAETYYESIGQNWERAAMIKARPVAGDIKAGNEFLERMRPFIWRKYLDFASIQDVHSIKRQINAHRGGAEIAVEGHNIKLGRGGIREIEFFAQTQQLIWGGRLPELRLRKTCESLEALAKAGQIDHQVAAELSESYWFLRRVEHRIQMVDDQQTHNLPADTRGVEDLSIFLSFPDQQSFREKLLSHLYRVERHYAELFEEAPSIDGEGTAEQKVTGNLIFTGADNDPETLVTLSKLGFSSPEMVAEIVRGWHHARYRATRSERSRQILTELMPVLLEAFGGVPDPDAAFRKFDEFLSGLPSGIQLFSMFHAYPELLLLLAEVLGSAPRLAEHLGRNPNVLESVLDRDFFDHLPTPEDMKEELDTLTSRADIFEDVLDIARRWANDRQLQIGVHALRHRLDWTSIGRLLSDVAVSAIDCLLGHVFVQFTARHGQITGAEWVVLAMGKLGGDAMTPSSDLDLIFVYRHAEDVIQSDGDKQLPPSQYFARFSQRLINAITATTTEGVLYEVDMRLRPSGNAGPIASHLSAFIQYHQDKSWTWEHMALSRARVICGSEKLNADISAIIKETLTKPRDADRLLKEVADMRLRIDGERHTDFIWDIKDIRGGLVDIEFIAQYLQLLHADAHPEILSTNTGEALTNLKDSGVLSEVHEKTLKSALELWQAMQGMLQLTIGGYFKPERQSEIPEALKHALAKSGGCEIFQTLEEHMKEVAAKVYGIFQEIIEEPAAGLNPEE